MHDEFTDQLSAYLDGELRQDERIALEEHLGQCAECSRVVSQLRRVVAWGPQFEGILPANDPWSSIEPLLSRRVFPSTQRARSRWFGRKVTIGIPHLLAAGIALVLLSGGTIWLLRAHTDSPVATISSSPKSWDYLRASTTEEQYDEAVTQLEGILAAGDSALDPATLKVIRQSLVAIDNAIQDAREAIARDSSNAYLNASIAANMRRKLDILRRAAQAVTAKS
jgi:hypothetical protein